MSDNILRHHKNGQPVEVRDSGIVNTKLIISDDYGAEEDPLVAKANVANKPGSSIPSVFGRMMFFNTALKNSKLTIPKNQHPSVYERIVSEWLDLMELIFNQSYKLKFTQWNAKEQIKALEDSNHNILADAFANQTAKYFEKYVPNIYVIQEKQTGKVIGATSPYTIVFTSPNWNSGRPIQLLLGRNKDFRLFLYRLAESMASNSELNCKVKITDPNTNEEKDMPNPAYLLVKSFVDYIDKNRKRDEYIEDSNLIINTQNSSIRPTSFKVLGEVYEEVTADIEGSNMSIEVADLSRKDLANGGDGKGSDLSLKLYQRKMNQIVSDFFIAGDAEGFVFNGETTPLILPDSTGYQTMSYYDGQNWEDGFDRFAQIENKEEVKREMPYCEAYRHNYLSSIDFLEDSLVSLPYRMEPKNFKGVINTANRSYLLPIKPKLLKYLKVETIIANLRVNIDDDGKRIEVSIGVPVRNNNDSRKNMIFFKKIYDLNADVVSVTKRDVMEQPISIGIAPFVRFNSEENARQNRHVVYLQYPKENTLPSTIEMEFWKEGEGIPLDEIEPIERESENVSLKSFIYKLKGRTFDALMLKLDDIGGMIIPSFVKPNEDGSRKYFYAIDFGTTNTHIAFTDNVMSTAESFSDKELHDMAVYLAEKPDVDTYLETHTESQLQNLLSMLYGRRGNGFLQEQARAFYPNFERGDYSFPIRTVSYEEQKVDDNLFGCFSIGFRYPKEIFQNAKYRTSLKWDLTKPGVQDAQLKAQMFFEEILEIIRIHWLSTGYADVTEPPVIMLTYPLVMGTTTVLKRMWNNAYVKVFGVRPMVAAQNIKELAESLAPAQKLIVNGESSTQGFLNVDIGGGTTDIQYYRQDGKVTAKYNSVLFAGDDLWGCGHENLSDRKRNVTENVFTRFADENMKDMRLKIGLEEMGYSKINLVGKEKINLLLRDENHHFASLITQIDQGNNAARKVIVLHYAAILYHIANWILIDADMKDKFPAVLTFTGFGSKYIDIIFGDDSREKLTEFTRTLLEAYGVTNIPEKFTVTFSDNPKAATAEGAAIFASQGTKNIPLRVAHHYGTNTVDPKTPVKLEMVGGIKKDVVDYFKNYVEAVKDVCEKDVSLNLPAFTESELNNFISESDISFDEVYSEKIEADETGQTRLSDSFFFWMLKDSLFNFDN